MAELFTMGAADVAPTPREVLHQQGFPAGHAVSTKVIAHMDSALALFAEFAEPVGLLQEIGRSDFARVFLGQRKNEQATPVGDILEQADRHALFAVTMGSRISSEVARRFESNDFLTASMLDAVASLAVDTMADLVARDFVRRLLRAGKVCTNARAMGYSPGCCGWDLSGQAALFDALRPGVIGVSLGDGFMMDPLKSVTGVVLVGPRQIHKFEANYEFCSGCTPKVCRRRIAALETN